MSRSQSAIKDRRTIIASSRGAAVGLKAHILSSSETCEVSSSRSCSSVIAVVLSICVTFTVLFRHPTPLAATLMLCLGYGTLTSIGHVDVVVKPYLAFRVNGLGCLGLSEPTLPFACLL